MSSREGIEKGGNAESLKSGLDTYPGLKESLDMLTDYERHLDATPYSYEQIVAILATDKGARDEAQSFLRTSPWERDSEAADGMLKQLAWSLVDELSRRLGQQ